MRDREKLNGGFRRGLSPTEAPIFEVIEGSVPLEARLLYLSASSQKECP
jgi:hypothetical protein